MSINESYANYTHLKSQHVYDKEIVKISVSYD